MPNLHSHAFQRGFAGLTERRSGAAGAAEDSFWSWRELMYRFAGRIGPESLQAVATWLYVEMLEAGYTQVCEFQYVHHQPDGTPYADDAALCRAVLRAAQAAGIGITLLPVLYQTSGFGGQAPGAGQRRFLRATDDMLSLWELLAADVQGMEAYSVQKPMPGARLGLAPHSLRAVPPEALREAVAGVQALDAGAPIHIHIAEQVKEVEDCLAWSGQRPVAWLLDHAPVDTRWCLVHATHMDADEYRRAAASGAVAGLCPSTEANLGDGVFDLLLAGRRWRLGHRLRQPRADAAEELMLLEYSQRLTRRQRNVGATADQPDVASALSGCRPWPAARAKRRGAASWAPGQRAGLRGAGRHPSRAGRPAAGAATGGARVQPRAAAPSTRWVAGRPAVLAGRHPARDVAFQAFRQARAALLDV